MTTEASSVPWLSENHLLQFGEDLARVGYSIQPQGLDPANCARLLGEARRLDASGRLRPAGIGLGGAEVPSIRGDRILWLEPCLAPATDEYLRTAEHLRLQLNRRLYLGLVEYEGHLACYGPGAGYRKHLDRIQGTDARVLTLIAYLNPDWSQSDGGQLRLYLPDGNTVDIMPNAGTLVAFLAEDHWHEVLPSWRERWAITGWFRQAALA